jgi:hypothetical protein
MKYIIIIKSFSYVFAFNLDLNMLHGSAGDDRCILQKIVCNHKLSRRQKQLTKRELTHTTGYNKKFAVFRPIARFSVETFFQPEVMANSTMCCV